MKKCKYNCDYSLGKKFIKEKKLKTYISIKDRLLKDYKCKKNYILRKFSLKYNNISLISNIIIFLFVNLIFIENNNALNIIKLKVSYGANLKIIEPKFTPSKVYVNGIESEITKGCINVLNKGINNITLEWDEKITDCEKMFKDLQSIIEADLSNFDLSEVVSLKYLFTNDRKLSFVNFSNVDTSLLTRMSSIFENCSSLTSIDFSGFTIPNVTHMDSMFKNCESLNSLNLSNLYTPNLKKINDMFHGCANLEYLDISNFNTDIVTDMQSCFENCAILTSINILHFNTLKTKNMSKMFKDCKQLKEIDLSNMDVSNVRNMSGMFYGCSSLNSLDLSNFITTKLEDLESMFNGCTSITSINLSNFNLVKVENMKSMFQNCFSILSLDLTNFDLSEKNIESLFYNCKSLKSIKFSLYQNLWDNISNMFYNCFSLKSVDLSYFDFSQVKNVSYLFYNCSSLKSIDFSNQNLTSVEMMDFMFSSCSSLVSINFTNFKTLYVNTFSNMFIDCISLISLDLSSFVTNLVYDMSYMFSNCHNLVNLDLSNFDTTSVMEFDSMFKGCYSLTSLNVTSFSSNGLANALSMFENCYNLKELDLSNFIFGSLQYLDKMFKNCTNLKYINLYNFNLEYFQGKEMFYKTSDLLIVCINEDSSTTLFKELYDNRCIINNCSNKYNYDERVIIYHNKKCIKDCVYDPEYKYRYKNYCYNECPLGTHSNVDNIYLCEKNIYDCFKEYPFIIKEDNTCADECSCIDFFNDICTVNKINNESQSLLFANIIKGIEDGLINDLIDEYLTKGEDLIKEENNAIYQLSSSLNTKNEKNRKISFINLTDCEKFLKEKYNILEDEQLFIFKTELYFDGLLMPLIDYEIFDLKNKTKLNLNYCKDNNIEINMIMKVSINENILFEYIPNSSYYTDICNIINDDEDITLYDRKNNFNNRNLSICPKYCRYNGYNYITQEVNCQCQIKDKIFFSYINNTDNLLYKFKIKKKILNLDFLKCYKLLFSKNGLIKNICNYLILLVIILYIISGIYFYKKGFDLICEQINDIINNKIFDEDQNKTELNKTGNFTKNLNNSKIDSPKSYLEFKLDNDNKYNEKPIKKVIEKQNSYIEYEINIIPYKEALENDRRTYFQFYISLLKDKNMLISIFNKDEDYNSRIIKICLLFFYFILNLFINSLFFNDYFMHKIYTNKGNYNFKQNITNIIYSIIIFSISIIIINRLFLTQKNILEIKHEKNKYIFKGKVLMVLKCIIIKFVSFFIVGIVILFLFWYYLSSFCAIYQNTKSFLFINGFISFLISLLFPFFICLFPGIFRMFSFKEPGKCLYKISQIIQLF